MNQNKNIEQPESDYEEDMMKAEESLNEDGSGIDYDNPNRANDDYEEDYDFIRCSECDGHDACEDFGCAYELGLGRMVKKGNIPGLDHWG